MATFKLLGLQVTFHSGAPYGSGRLKHWIEQSDVIAATDQLFYQVRRTRVAHSLGQGLHV